MSISVVVGADQTPPKFEITVASPDGTAMTAVSLTRTADGATVPTRVQPVAGTASAYVDDPEAPWDTPVTYTARITYGSGATATYTSPAQTLTPAPAAMWAIHPTVPSLSRRLDTGDPSVMGLASIADITRAALATKHRIIGSSTQVVTKVGNRAAPAGALQVTTTSLQELTDLLALVNDETPLLIRAPAAWGWAWQDGYYAIGDVGEGRRLQYGPDPTRTITLPYERVTAPAGQQQSSWSWGGLLNNYADWPSVTAAFADWPSVTGDNPS